MTRQAYGLDRIEEKEFPADEKLDARPRSTRNDRDASRTSGSGTTGRCCRPSRQLQEIRTYYKFVDVDNDRYIDQRRVPPGDAVARASSPISICRRGRDWINEHLTYTHGYGVVVGPVNRITPEGLPEFFVKDIPPQSAGGFPKITRPEIYFGEIAQRVRLGPHRSQELDYPLGDQNVYTRYAGRGRRPGRLLVAAAGLRGPLRRAQDPPVRRPHAREPRS